MLKLYYARRTISVATAITLAEAGLEYEPVRVDFTNGEQNGAAYRAINSKGRVPALAAAQGILTENGAIEEYIAALAPKARLVPDDAFNAARMREVMYYLASTMHVNHAHGQRAERWADSVSARANMVAKVTENMTECCEHIETDVLEGPFVLGDRISLADPYLYMLCCWLPGDGVDREAFSKISAFMETMGQRDSVRAVVQLGML